ncbi:MAG: WD40/YVTN/BNR-like repeat-containing protein [Chitinophagaceae bacterium]
MNIFNNLAVLLVFQFLSCNQSPEFTQASQLTDSLGNPRRESTGTTNIVFRSADNGETWQDISDGLPDPVIDSFSGGRRVFFADHNGLWLTDGKGIFHSKPDFTAPFWTKADFPDEKSSISPGKNGIYAFHYLSGIFQKSIGTSEWSPVFTDFKDKRVRGVLETAGGEIYITSDKGLFKSSDRGESWKTIYAGGLGGKLVESKGVLLTTGPRGIMRSTDDGENWYWVIRDGGVGIDVAKIKGGFAAITYSTASKTRRVRTSYDDGKTWQPIDAGLPAQLSISTIIQVGENFFCGHPNGIYRSSDKVKCWELLLPSVDGKVFNLSVSGNVIYAIPRNAGC